jgi:LDH2 family malate/lactate/ureidoglycolate dehydrogenase
MEKEASMVEQFKLKPEESVRVGEEALRATVQAMFQKVGLGADDAALATDVLVTADLRGVDTHGVSNLLRLYLERYQNGNINLKPNWRIVRESPTTATIDSDTGHGIIITPKAMEIAVEKARKTGVGMVTVTNARHLAMAAYHAMIPLKHDMIGVCMTSTPPTVVPTFASKPLLGTNPIAFAAPAGQEPPFVFDAATSVIPDNKVHIARRLGVPLLPGWLADDQGRPIMEPTPAPEFGKHKLLPLGSAREMGSHKGYGLGAIVDVLCAVLSNSGFGAMRPRMTFAHYVAAYNIEAFTDLPKFKSMMDEFLRTLKSTPPAPGHERVLVAGQLEWETMQDRRKNGIPLHQEVIDWFKKACGDMGIAYNLT